MIKGFDLKGFLEIIEKVKISLPNFQEKGFCQVCKGAHFPIEKKLYKGRWYCQSWYIGPKPVFKICRLFQYDLRKYKEILQKELDKQDRD